MGFDEQNYYILFSFMRKFYDSCTVIVENIIAYSLQGLVLQLTMVDFSSAFVRGPIQLSSALHGLHLCSVSCLRLQLYHIKL